MGTWENFTSAKRVVCRKAEFFDCHSAAWLRNKEFIREELLSDFYGYPGPMLANRDNSLPSMLPPPFECHDSAAYDEWAAENAGCTFHEWLAWKFDGVPRSNGLV